MTSNLQIRQELKQEGINVTTAAINRVAKGLNAKEPYSSPQAEQIKAALRGNSGTKTTGSDRAKTAGSSAQQGTNRMLAFLEETSEAMSDKFADALEESVLIKTMQKFGGGEGPRSNRAYEHFETALMQPLENEDFLLEGTHSNSTLYLSASAIESPTEYQETCTNS